MINLQSVTYKMESLYIRTPVTIVGKPETILDVDGGSIHIDFGQAEIPNDNYGDDDFIVPNTPARD